MAMRDDEKYSPPKSTASQAKDEQQGIFLILVNGIFGTGKWLIISLCFSLLISFIGVTFIWPEQGANHEKTTLQTEVNYLASELSHASFVKLLVASQETRIWEVPLVFGNAINKVVAVFNENLVVYGETANYTMRIFFVRVILLVTSLPILLIYGICAFTIGLVERDLRRFNLARESSTKFHLILNNVHLPLVWLMMLYLSWPVTAHPLPFILPGYVLFGLLIYTMTAGYKKYF